jgi:hypothetical protein
MVHISTVLLRLLAAAMPFFGVINAPAGGEQVASADGNSTDTLGRAVVLRADEAAVISRSAARFAEAGLELPSGIVTSFHDHVDDCGGNYGLSPIEAGLPRIRLCWIADNRGALLVVWEQLLVHEMAHSWVEANVDQTGRDRFVLLTGSDSWRSSAANWENRGIERGPS